MECDWEYEIGGGTPVIDAGWSGFVNLVRRPDRIPEIAEGAAFPPLAQALLRLNGADSPVWTAKCDFWPALEPGSFDPDEMDATPASASGGAVGYGAGGADGYGCCGHGAGGYIDLLARDAERWESPESAARDCRALLARLRALPLRNCRMDLVVREASFGPGREGFGLTAYLTACGADAAAAQAALALALDALAATLSGGW